MKELKKQIQSKFNSARDKNTFLNELKEFLHEISPVGSQPVDLVRWVPIEKVQPNDYNPNSVARTEMKLLHTSISHDGYTQPIVTIWDEKIGKYIIVDGFHRYFVALNNKDIYDRNKGLVPVTVIDKDINDRMASTVRHNRARGKHSISGMSSMVFNMLDNGWEDAAICNELGMEPEELLKLKHITGFSKLFKDTEYSRSWVTKHQIIIKKKFDDEKEGKPTD